MCALGTSKSPSLVPVTLRGDCPWETLVETGGLAGRSRALSNARLAPGLTRSGQGPNSRQPGLRALSAAGAPKGAAGDERGQPPRARRGETDRGPQHRGAAAPRGTLPGNVPRVAGSKRATPRSPFPVCSCPGCCRTRPPSHVRLALDACRCFTPCVCVRACVRGGLTFSHLVSTGNIHVHQTEAQKTSLRQEPRVGVTGEDDPRGMHQNPCEALDFPGAPRS